MYNRRANPYKSLLGIELGMGRITVVWVSRTGPKYAVLATKTAALKLDPLSHDPELAGQEIRNWLDQWGIRERNCVVCIPLQWILSRSIAMPDLPPEDRTNYVRLQAEREFPFAADDLSISLSHYLTPGRRTCAMIAAIPLNHTVILQRVFRAAKLKPVSLTASVACLGEDRPGGGLMVLSVKETSIEILIRGGGGVAGLRRMEYDAAGIGEDEEEIQDMLVREIRITLGQLPEDWRGAVQEILVYGSRERTEPLLHRIAAPLAELGLRVVSADSLGAPLAGRAPSLEPVFQPLALTVLRFLETGSAVLEFLPPKINRFQQVTQRISSRSNLVLGGTALAVLLITAAAFFYQYYRLSRLEAEWNRIESRVAQVEEIQGKVKQFRAWFDESVTSLEILKSLTEAFPEEGVVWAKILEIQDQSIVSCAGFAKSNADWLEMIDRLAADPRVADFQLQQVQGDAPLQFAFHFQWWEGGRHE
ncbi:MAG: hypothetical protein HPY51_19395 [Candidatus Omnitrophica bacterium]|nr:hypothetical protein [Candidatus Omnitrophota bacterium]